MAIESSGYVNVNGLWIEKDGCFYDSVKFMYTDVDGKTQYTEEDCGIFNADACDICYDTNQTHDQTPATTKLSLVGTDMKMVFDSDYSINGGFVDFNWQCRSYGNDICPPSTTAAPTPDVTRNRDCGHLARRSPAQWTTPRA